MKPLAVYLLLVGVILTFLPVNAAKSVVTSLDSQWNHTSFLAETRLA